MHRYPKSWKTKVKYLRNLIKDKIGDNALNTYADIFHKSSGVTRAAFYLFMKNGRGSPFVILHCLKAVGIGGDVVDVIMSHPEFDRFGWGKTSLGRKRNGAVEAAAETCTGPEACTCPKSNGASTKEVVVAPGLVFFNREAMNKVVNEVPEGGTIVVERLENYRGEPVYKMGDPPTAGAAK